MLSFFLGYQGEKKQWIFVLSSSDELNISKTSLRIKRWIVSQFHEPKPSNPSDTTLLRGLNKETQNTTLLMVMCYKEGRLRGIIFGSEKVDAFQASLFFSLTDINEKIDKYDDKLLISPSEVIWKVNTLTHFASDHAEQNCAIWRWVVVRRILKKMINGTFINEFST